jgi:hypothetical protein
MELYLLARKGVATTLLLNWTDIRVCLIPFCVKESSRHQVYTCILSIV